MLFYPRNPRKFLGVTFHGVFPKRQSELANRLGELFAEQLGVQSKIEQGLANAFDQTELEATLRVKVKELAMSFIQKEVPFLAAMVPAELIDNLSLTVSTQLSALLEEKLKQGASSLGQGLDVKSIVKTQIEALEVEKLEEMLQGLLKKEFRFIEFSGAFLGFFIGCLQVLLSMLIFSAN